jgi:aryl-alcohol dehydrogenase-like predicted oxidoreductase
MKTRKLRDLEVSALGLGCMGMSEFYGPADDAESLKVLERALELGVTFYDTADMYGHGHNEELLAKFIKGKRDRLVIATKCAIRRQPGTYTRTIDNSPDYIRQACDASLQRLGIDCIDLYYIHRIEVGRPIEETAAALAGLVQAGKVRAIGFSEISAATLEKAHAVHPVTAVQSEFSLWARETETNGVQATCARLGIGFVPYSPLGRGFLTGKVGGTAQLDAKDFRRISPRFQQEHLDAQQQRLDLVKAIAAAHAATPAQVALAWVLARPGGLVPIPGTKRLRYLEENAAAASLELTQDDLARLDAAFPPDADYGARYPEAGMSGINA